MFIHIALYGYVTEKFYHVYNLVSTLTVFLILRFFGNNSWRDEKHSKEKAKENG